MATIKLGLFPTFYSVTCCGCGFKMTFSSNNNIFEEIKAVVWLGFKLNDFCKNCHLYIFLKESILFQFLKSKGST